MGWQIVGPIVAVIVAIAGILWGAKAGVDVLEQRGYERADSACQISIGKLQTEANATLAAETKKVLAAQASTSNLVSKLETEREKNQALNRADLQRRLQFPERLQFHTETSAATQCGSSGGDAAAAAPGTASDPGTALIQLPGPVERGLREIAADANSLLIDYKTLYDFVHDPRVSCTRLADTNKEH